MRAFLRSVAIAILLSAISSFVFAAQSTSTSGTISGTITDPSGAVIPGATVAIHNAVSEYQQTVKTDNSGHFQFTNVPFNPYHLTVSAAGFDQYAQDVNVRSAVPVTVDVGLQLATASNTVVVEGGSDLLETDSTMHTDVDRNLIQKLPLESATSSVSSLVTLSSPGVTADSNGMFHGMGDHAENSFSVDGQPITDQQSKVFSNQIPSDSIQSMEVIAGAPPAEYGDKTSLVIKVTTRSGQGVNKPTGTINTSYGTFGTVNSGFDLAYGNNNWGNFISANGLNTGRFLDPPEFKVFHDKGNEQNIFDRIDYQLTQNDSLHLNLNYTRSWFQTPNAYDNLNVLDQNGNSVGQTDQKSKIETFNISPTYTRLINNYSVFNFGAYARKDAYNYFPSSNPLADLGPIQSETIGQRRTLLNAGAHSDISYVRGAHNFKTGIVYEQTILRENDALGIVNPTLNSPCVDANGNPVKGFLSPAECSAAGYGPNPDFNPVLLPYDLTRSGGLFGFHGHTAVKQTAMYAEDQITKGRWLFSIGIRGDLYNGLTVARAAQPRAGISYNIKKTNTVLRVSYGRMMETPFNENLVLSSQGCVNPVLSPLLSCTPGVSDKLNPGFRNEFHAGLQQAFGRNFVISGEYVWKYTHNAYDFSVLGNTPITFPINWHNSKIPGLALRADVPNFHNISAFVVMSSVSARFFPPQVGGAGATIGQSGYPFRIDHDERFNQTTHIQYQLPWEKLKNTWFGFNWRFDSGAVAGSVPCYNVTDPNSRCNPVNGGPSITLPNGQPGIDLSGLTPDQQFEAGLICDGVRATPTSGFTACDANGLTSNLVKIPAPGTENDDKNPARIQPRSLFDMALGDDNLFNGDRYKWGVRLTAVNMTNKYALYNFLSTFSGTHYVTPRAITGQISFSF